ncbi:MAG: gfo/Idh/MocA family oxidoreductase, partial [Candidatus Hydrogenedentes bacterium]|nr:gfo/Idh/MocA family oxidoreductase [Candidatus Hydrogenedentota bacterium]
SKGMLTCGTYGQRPRLLPEADFANFQKPAQTLPRLEKEDPYIDWVNSIKSGKPSVSNFDYAASFTEIILLGNLALRAGTSIQWDIKNMRVTNSDAANELVKKQYREGWSL